MKEDMKDKGLLGGVVLAAIAASVCCIGPLLFAGAGVTAIVIADKFAVIRPYLLVVTGILLLAGFYYAYRPNKVCCETGSACAIPGNRRRARIGLWLATAFAVVLTTFPYWSAAVARRITQQPQNQVLVQAGGLPVEKATLRISGMVCEMCALGIENTLRKQPGVRSARVSFSESAAEVEYDASQLSVPRIQSVIEKIGYHVVAVVAHRAKEE